ncbi:hypothetical protein [Acinetobacter kyonggiensis]|uniref:Uncharacterized protein n=1 Tax=Acinetobacter kyonggiensis TaxID=595670 RepID=A0A1H3NDR3_9GAMM|nr:hypothetical protein [Acinetobacter kyonggiensis]SDY86329.1 hypothetical protein SAMN05421643_1424 [Acinetobacter kyonggiensis]
MEKSMLREATYPSQHNGYYPVKVLYGFVLDDGISYLLIFSPKTVRDTPITGLSTQIRGDFFNLLLKECPDEFFSEKVKVIQIIKDDFDRFYGREWDMNQWHEATYVENSKCKFFIETLNLQTPDGSDQIKIQGVLG